MTLSDALSKVKHNETVYCVLWNGEHYGIYQCSIDGFGGSSIEDTKFDVSSVYNIEVNGTVFPQEMFFDEKSAIPLFEKLKKQEIYFYTPKTPYIVPADK